ncbi:AsmA family protein [Vibrio maerlii]|uniref:AsmA family protein n=1 Tax=Vibrio maerlii TaxID=2231648 RepID=UPI000E3CD9EC|nr:AsmA family protein [Vibrio maerlii]
MKKLFLFLGVPLFAIVAAFLALILLINPNQFKPLIVEQAKTHTGLDLVIEGDISWQFFPAIGFELGRTELRNPQGFESQNLFKVEKVGIEVSVQPLLSQTLEIGNVVLDGAEFNLETLKDGRTNLDALTQAQSAQTEETATETSEAAPTPESSSSETSEWTLQLAGISVSNAAVEINDKQAGSLTKLYDVSLNLSEFAIETWTKATFAAKAEINEQNISASGDLEFLLSQGFADYALRNINLNASYKDPSNDIESIKLALDTFEFDKVNAVTFGVKGQAAGLDVDMNGTTSLMVDKAVSLVKLTKLTLDADLQGETLPQSPMKIAMNSDLEFDITKNHLKFILERLAANAIELDGNAEVTLADIPKVRFALHSPNIDLDEFLGLSQSTEETGAAEGEGTKNTSSAKAEPQPEVEPDLSALKIVDVKGEISIDKFKANNAKLQNVKAAFLVKDGIAELTSFTSNLYQGSISATAKLDGRKTPATYTAVKNIQGVKVQPMLIDVAQNDMLEGTGNIQVNVKGSSLTPTGIMENLAGTIGIKFEDGAVNGINVAKLIRENYAKFKGDKVEATAEAEKTDFSAMEATLKLNKGIVTTDNLTMQSPLLRIRGNGSANYLKETVDFTVSTSFVGSLEGQGGKDIDELKDVTIPVNISGSWADPKFKLVFDDVLKQKAQKELDRGVEKITDKIKDEKTKKAVDGLLKGLFN